MKGARRHLFDRRIRIGFCYTSRCTRKMPRRPGYTLSLSSILSLPCCAIWQAFHRLHTRTARPREIPESARVVRNRPILDAFVSLHDVFDWWPRRRVVEPVPLPRDRTNLVTRRKLIQSSAQGNALRRVGEDPCPPVLVSGPVGMDQADVIRGEEGRFGREVAKEGRERGMWAHIWPRLGRSTNAPPRRGSL